MTDKPSPSSADLAARMLAAYHRGDIAAVLALGEPIATLDDVDETALLLLGAAQQSSQRLHEAMATFRRLVQRKPAAAEYWNNLAVVARQLGDADAAEDALRRAVALAPQEAQIHYNLGLLYAEQQRWMQAREALLDAVALVPAFIDARLQAAHACYACGDHRGEQEMLQGAADWPPQPAEQALLLATMLSAQGEQATAFRVIEQAVLPADESARIMRWRIAALRASMHERSNQLDLAEAELARVPLHEVDAALSQSPALATAAWQAHAAVAAQRADTEHAASLYRRMLELSDGPDTRATAAFGLAGVMNKQGRHKEAWLAAQTAHAAQWDIASALAPELTVEGSQPLAMAGQRVSHVEFDRWTTLHAPRNADSPVFVVGFPRSGTTLLEQMLDAHPDFRSMDERDFVYELIHRMQAAGQSYPQDLGRLAQDEAEQLRSLYLDMSRRVVPDLGQRRLVDKNPLNMLCLPMIARLFPEARIVMCLRHPCDVLLSCYMLPFRAPPFMVLCSSLKRLAEGYVQAFEQWYHHVEVFAPRVLEWRYESVVSRFDEHVARLGQFLEIADAAPMASFAEHARAKGYISTPSYAQVTQGIHARAVNRWHAYREHFEPVLPILRPMLERLGYEA
ncbi:tetratricopeptide repeat-containing sulfotransferase family protein [Dyella jiangningensis]|uniref:Sulfotransferase n=1 Tax=Dyella jiangningensis TaxID=1379159 RepID=A0A328P2G9_9GAMM|nr:tetratricopeptide repeat-containing sulfotransferase family protein [Dyella jiangningensis]RAO74725.1 sulfotransferase [Dyella jiangningensis]